MDRFDALIIGGGPAGAAAGTLLARAGWQVVIAERKEFPRRKVCGEYLSATNWPLLEALGVADSFAELAGPAVREVAVLAGRESIRADLPRPACQSHTWGRALSREHLDTLLADQAARCGVDFRQPSRCLQVTPSGSDGFVCRLQSLAAAGVVEIQARVVIAAHGSWDIGPLATERSQALSRPGDWLAFKAHFQRTDLPPGLMPLLSFPDGYGGMAHCDGGRASVSCCVLRRRLDRLPRSAGQAAGDAVLGHILDSLPALRPVLEQAQLDGPWLSAGPIQPGLRPCYTGGVFVIGNAAGEAHPVVAEGISMALQSAWLLAERLIPHRREVHQPHVRDRIGRSYSAAWHRSFAGRIRAAALVAQWASRPRLVLATLPLLRQFPTLLTWGARLSGKTHVVVSPPSNAASREHCRT